MFPEYATPTLKDLPDMGQTPSSSSAAATSSTPTTVPIPPLVPFAAVPDGRPTSTGTADVDGDPPPPLVAVAEEAGGAAGTGVEAGTEVGEAKTRGWRREIIWAVVILFLSWATMNLWEGE